MSTSVIELTQVISVNRAKSSSAETSGTPNSKRECREVGVRHQGGLDGVLAHEASNDGRMVSSRRRDPDHVPV